MIYLKNNSEKQDCFIPKNGNYIGRKTYKEGMEAQKALISAITIDDNGIYTNENGYSPVEVALPIGKTTITENGVYDFSNGAFQKDTSIDIGGVYVCQGCGYMFAINGVGNWSLEVIFKNANSAGEYFENTMRGIIGDKNIYIAEDATDPNYIFARYGDWESGRYAIDEEFHYLKLNEEGFWIDNVLMEVNTNNTPVEIEEWVMINGINGFNIQETYNYPNLGYYQAVRIGFNGETKIFAYPDGNGYIDVNGEDRYGYIWKVSSSYPQYMPSVSVGYGWREVRGMKEVSVNVGDCPEMPVIGTLEMDVTENQTYYRDASDGYDAYDRVIVNVNVPQIELYPLDVTENGSYEGAYNVVNVNVPQGEGCNLEDKLVNPSMADRDDNGYVIVNPSEGYDGLSRAVIDPSTIYNEGVEAGKAECDDCNLEDKWITPSMDDRDDNGLIVVNPSEGYDGLRRAVIDPQTIYNEGVEEGKTQGGDCPELTTLDVTENGTYEGAFNVVNVEVPQEGGSCNLEYIDREINPYSEPYYSVFTPSEGYDGFSQVIVRTENAFNLMKEEGRNEVRNSLGSLNVTENGTYSTSDAEEVKYINFGQDGNVWYSASNTLSSNTEIEIAFMVNNDNHENQVLIGGENFAVSFGGGAVQGVVNGIATWNRGYKTGANDVNIVKINSGGIFINENHLSWTDNESGVNLWEQITNTDLFIGSSGGDGEGNPEGKGNFKNSILYFTINGTTFYPTEDLKFGEQTNMGTGTPTYVVSSVPKYSEEGWKEIVVNVPTIQEQIRDYYYCPLIVADAGFGELAKSWDEDDVVLNNYDGAVIEDVLYIPTLSNRNEFRTKEKARFVQSINIQSDSMGYLEFGDGVEYYVNNSEAHNYTSLTKIVLGSDMETLNFGSTDSFPTLNEIWDYSISSEFDVYFSIPNVKSGGTLYLKTQSHESEWRNNLPEDWTIEYI